MEARLSGKRVIQTVILPVLLSTPTLKEPIKKTHQTQTTTTTRNKAQTQKTHKTKINPKKKIQRRPLQKRMTEEGGKRRKKGSSGMLTRTKRKMMSLKMS